MSDNDSNFLGPEKATSGKTNANDRGPIIRLDDFLKCRGMVGTGGEAKILIQAGDVCLNGEVETRRRKQLVIGDVVDIDDETLIVNETDFD
ncbi:RNA-binding S4 domain protein [Rhodopirellula maiorica SM1]|uniref:RNA-binding S4 domain protein n=1 Tax=Rhodopirellula maiorica SM1 TaxID=1265738 RepID=M5RK39_9BACT|nr:RNA-binding S4 domain-containing protein [Rhodopirellula maiorica]EMI19675.1 RNA-binding S4 domain protein [Rhodopirellula maiorica SM1]